jgi:hypothetical protein
VYYWYIDGGGFLIQMLHAGIYKEHRSYIKPLGQFVICADGFIPPEDWDWVPVRRIVAGPPPEDREPEEEKNT